ncbi:MAG TPA: hypothetical protein VIL46_17005 [Gemmataceae bacterium]
MEPIGRTLPLSPPRRWVADLMHFSRKVPLVTFQRRMRLGELVAARKALPDPPSLVVLFLKAYGQVAARRPELRRLYLPFPRPRLYEHPFSVATVAVERQWRGEPAVFFAPFRSPEEQSLSRLAEHLKRYKTAPVESVGVYRRLLRVSRYPLPLRRLLWWWALNSSGNRRARYAGTFSLSVTAGLGAAAVRLLSPSTATLHYAPLDPGGEMDVYLTFDHRVLDGAPVARALADLEETLCTGVTAELRQMRAAPAA